MSTAARLNFVHQQGFRDASPAECDVLYPALMWQPRVSALILLAGLIWQAWPVFLGLSVLLWWNALVPERNLFNSTYNRFLAERLGRPPVPVAPAPRRFAQGMAGSFCLAIAVCLFFGWHVAAYVFEAFLVAAVSSLIFGKFCLGSYIFHWLRRDGRFANRTLPWAHPEIEPDTSAAAKAAR